MQTTYHNITQEKVQRQDKKLCIKTKYFKLTKNKENLYGTPGALLESWQKLQPIRWANKTNYTPFD